MRWWGGVRLQHLVMYCKEPPDASTRQVYTALAEPPELVFRVENMRGCSTAPCQELQS